MEKVNIGKNKLFFWAVIISVLNPILSGLIIGLVMLTEPDLRKEGGIVAFFSVVWGVIALLLMSKFKHLLIP